MRVIWTRTWTLTGKPKRKSVDAEADPHGETEAETFFPPPAVGFCYLKGATRSPPGCCVNRKILKFAVDAAPLQ